MYHYAGNNPVKYTDPDGREDYDSTITQEQFNSIAFRISVPENENGKKKILTWDEIQEFFKQNPNGCISRNPDELMYVLYTDKSKVQEYNMLTNDLLDIYLIGKGICKLVGNTVKKVLAKQAAKQTAKQAVKSTGRTIAKNLTEQLAMEQVKSSLTKGRILKSVIINDAKNGWYAKDGWVKMAQNVNGVEIHYLWNTITQIAVDFKFK